MVEPPVMNLRLIGLVLLAILLTNGALIAAQYTSLSRRKQPLFAARWSLTDLWFGVQILLIALVVLLIPVMFFAFTSQLSYAELTEFTTARSIYWLLLPATLVQNVAFFLVPAGFINLKYKLPLRAIGLPKLPSQRDVTAGILLGLIGMGLSALIESGVGTIAEHFKHVPLIHAAMQVDKDNAIAHLMDTLPHLGIGGMLLVVLAVGISAPLGEEMVFRAFTFNAFKRRLGLIPGIFFSALLFTLPHGYGLGLIPVFFLGAFMAWVYNNSGSLWVTIFLHATNNSIGVLAAFLLPQMARH